MAVISVQHSVLADSTYVFIYKYKSMYCCSDVIVMMLVITLCLLSPGLHGWPSEGY